MTHEDNLLRLAQAEGECPTCKGKGWLPHYNREGDPTGLSIGCVDCGGSGGEIDLAKGTGRVPLIEGVRVECVKSVRPLLALHGVPILDKNVDEREHQERFHRDRCRCQGRRWTPSTDPMAWAKGIHGLFEADDEGFNRGAELIFEYGDRFLEGNFPAAIQAAVDALEAAGLIEKEEA